MGNSTIEWTNMTWNPVTGCDKISQGCKFCYAEVFYERFNGKGSFKTITCHEERLVQPFKWKKPVLCFVNSMSDLFHDEVPFSFIRKVFGVMSVCSSTTFQILTKRPKRMLEFFEWMLASDPDFMDDPAHEAYDLCVEYGIETGCGSAFETTDWPLKNVWLGVSVEDQKAADERIPFLLQCPATVHFLSCEPLLGPIDLSSFNTLLAHICLGSEIDWVIVGGESGNRKGVRPMHPDWVRSIRDQCVSAGVPFFFKQWGQYYTKWIDTRTQEYIFKMYDSYLRFTQKLWVNKGDKLIDLNGKICMTGGDMMNAEYPVAIMNRVGKKTSGRLLDGKTHDEFPKQLPVAKLSSVN